MGTKAGKWAHSWWWRRQQVLVPKCWRSRTKQKQGEGNQPTSTTILGPSWLARPHYPRSRFSKDRWLLSDQPGQKRRKPHLLLIERSIPQPTWPPPNHPKRKTKEQILRRTNSVNRTMTTINLGLRRRQRRRRRRPLWVGDRSEPLWKISWPIYLFLFLCYNPFFFLLEWVKIFPIIYGIIKNYYTLICWK